ncbi:MAG TPA: hypothetical protein VMJ49_07430 [Gaiellaceae bacterium]|nr:hypothetical protein [Gaiellaceae bacterium]
MSSAGEPSDGISAYFAISTTGRFVAFDSEGTNLTTGDGNGVFDVFVRDRKRRRTERISLSSAGTEGNGESFDPAISTSGRHVAFATRATNLAGEDANGADDILVRDRKTRRTTRVSVSSDGTEANGAANDPGISSNGRYVVFSARASNLVDGDGNGASDVFVHDRARHETTRVSVADDGGEANDDSELTANQSAISKSGRYVVFDSDATNLVAGDTNLAGDVFVRDRKTRTTRRVSVSSTGAEGNGGSYNATISASRRYVVFTSSADNLVPGDTNGTNDVFVHDRQTHETTRANLSSDGLEGDGGASDGGISADGRFVVFVSGAANLVLDDTNQRPDVFLRDRTLGTTTRLSVGPAGVEANDNSFDCALSADGRFVGFDSYATNLVAGDLDPSQEVFLRGPLR